MCFFYARIFYCQYLWPKDTTFHTIAMYEDSNLHAFYARNYPLFRQCLPVVKSHFDNCAGLEVEARIGRFENGRFVNGVSLAVFEGHLAMLRQYPDWAEPAEWEQHVDYFYTQNGASIRQRCGPVAGQGFCTSAIVKTVCQKSDFRICQDDISEASGAIRIQKSREIPDSSVADVPAVLPTMVRIVQRISFLYRGQWRFDLSKVWAGKSFNEADRLKSGPPTSCEIEVELVESDPPVRDYRASSVFLSVSLLLKALDFFTGVSEVTQI